MTDSSARRGKMQISRTLETSRRRFLFGAAAATLAAPAVVIPGRARAANSLVFVGWGGTAQKIYSETVLLPVARSIGVELIQAYGPDLAKLKAQIVAGQVEWDLMSLTGAMAVGGARQGLFEPIDYSLVTNAADLMFPKREACLQWYVYTGGIGYDPRRFAEGKFPTDWPEFWDVRRFPGRRGLRNRADEILEIALMADGVKPKELYPLDVDRAFKSLDRIKPHISQWIAQTQQTVSLIQTNEIDFTYTYRERVRSAQQQGASLGFADKTPLVSITYVAVAKGTKNKTAAMKLLNGILSPEMQGAFVNALPGNGPVVRGANKYIQPKILQGQPDPSAPNVAINNDDWWADNYVATSQRFKEWLLTG